MIIKLYVCYMGNKSWLMNILFKVLQKLYCHQCKRHQKLQCTHVANIVWKRWKQILWAFYYTIKVRITLKDIVTFFILLTFSSNYCLTNQMSVQYLIFLLHAQLLSCYWRGFHLSLLSFQKSFDLWTLKYYFFVVAVVVEAAFCLMQQFLSKTKRKPIF